MVVVEKVVKRYKKDAEDPDYEEGDSQLSEAPLDEEEEEEETKPKEKVREVAPIIIGAPEATDMDRMIEVIWTGSNVPSTALLCATNFIEQ